MYLPTVAPAELPNGINANDSVVNTARGNADIKIQGRILPALKLARSIRLPITKSAMMLINLAAKMMIAIAIKSASKILLKNSA